MNIRSELQYAFHPRKSLKFWLAIYLVVIIAIVSGLLVFASHIKTRITPVGGITLTTNYSEYVVGEHITFTLTNDYNSPIDFTTHCPAEPPLAIYKQSGSTWVRLHGAADSAACATQSPLVHVPPLATASSSLAPWQNLFATPGNYRLVAMVNGATTLPYTDISVISSPVAIIQQITTPGSSSTSISSKSAGGSTQTTTSGSSTSSSSSSSSTNPTSSPQPTPTPTPTPTHTPQTYTLSVNSSGNYATTSLTIYSGDSIKFVYTAPRNNEVRTRFTAIAPTTATLSTVTVDGEFTTRTVTYTTVGRWTYKADDYNGNSGILTVQ